MMPLKRFAFKRLLALAGLVTALALGCSGKTKQAGGLELIIATDMETPSTFDAVGVTIEQQTGDGTWGSPPLFEHDYPIPDKMTLPTSISLRAGDSPYQQARITVTARKGGLQGSAIVRSVIETRVPTDRLAELTIFLSRICRLVECPNGNSCQPVAVNGVAAGACGPPQVPETELKAYSPGDLMNAGVASTTVDGGMSFDAGDGGDASTARPNFGDSGDGPVEPPGGDSGGHAPADDGAIGLADVDAASDKVVERDAGGEGGVKLPDASVAAGDAGDAGGATCPVCGTHQTCQMNDGGAKCVCNSTICTRQGPMCSDRQTIATCASDANQCLYVSQSTPCLSPNACSGMAASATCSPTCQDSCTLGQTACDPAGLKTCTRGTDSCLALSAPVACGQHQSCSTAVTPAACKCVADPVCMGAGKACINTANLATCAVDAQGCAYQTSTTACTEGPCTGGVCTDGLRHGPFKMLVLSTAEAFAHDSIPTGLQMLTDLGNTSDADLAAIGAPAGSQWTVDTVAVVDPTAATYLSEINAANLNNYELVYSNNPSGQVFTKAADGALKKQIFQDYFDNGGSWAGHHAATDFEKSSSWSWFQDNVNGGWMADHDGVDTSGTVSVETAYSNHPIIKGLPIPWDVRDEWFRMNRVIQSVAGFKVLAKVTVPTSPIDTTPRPAIWIRENLKGGRSFYTIRGHNKAVYAEPAFRELILRGILWSVHRLK